MAEPGGGCPLFGHVELLFSPTWEEQFGEAVELVSGCFEWEVCERCVAFYSL